MNLGVRVGSAAVLVAGLAAALWIGGPLLDVVLGLVCLAALAEFAGLSTRAWGRPSPVVLYPLGVFLLFRFLLPHDVPALEWGLGAAVVLGLFGSLVVPERAGLGWALGVGGALYVGLSLGYWLGLLRWHGGGEERFGLRIVGTVLVAAIASDTAALFVGRALGRRPFFPGISPNKTLEGALGGVAACVVVVAVGAPWLLGLGPLRALALGALIAAAAQGGDLVESSLKRAAGEKDSGGLIPGHGGVLDRLDSLVLLGPVVYCFLRVIDLP